MSSEKNATLSTVLRQSLQDVLMDESFGSVPVNTRPLKTQYNALQQRLDGQTFLPDFFKESANAQRFGLLSRETKKSPYGLGLSNVSPLVRPSAVLGLTSNELLLAAAAEQRMLNQARATAIRHQALVKESFQHQLYNNSLRSLMLPKAVQAPPSQIEDPSAKQVKGALQALGRSLRKNTAYVDVSALSNNDQNDASTRKTRGGVVEQFPEKLHRMLQEVEEAGQSDIISFFSHGRAFRVHDADGFVREVMPKYFKQSRLPSFLRQLNLYGFNRIHSGPDAGGYYHELFLKGRPALSMHMLRVGVPKGEDRRKSRSTNKHCDPDFYAMRSLANLA